MKRVRNLGQRAAWITLALVVLFSNVSTAHPRQVSTAHPRQSRNGITVMTQNLYLGASLDSVLGADDPVELLFAVADTWQAVQDTDFPERAKSIADQIAEQKPALIGLQEAALWRVQSPGDLLVGGSVPATEVVYDFVEILIDQLAERGLDYEVAVSQDEMDVELPSITGDDIRFTDRDVILVRRSRRHGRVRVLATDADHFDTLLTLPVAAGPPVEITRGWVSADVKVRGRRFRFLNTHLESVYAPVQEAQALELVAGPLDTCHPVICLGDFNSDAFGEGTQSYEILLASGLEDAWTEIHDDAPGLTWGQAADLLNPISTMSERLDLILFQGRFRVRDIFVVGDRQEDRTATGLWPSDHAGVIARIR